MMMKRTPLLSVVIGLASLGIAGTVLANTTEKKFDLTSFDRVKTLGSANTRINVGPEFSVVLKGDAQALENYEAVVEQGELLLRPKPGAQRNMQNGRVEAYITMPKLVGLALAGSGDIQARGVDAQDFSSAIAGSGNIKLEGNCANASYKIAGSGNLSARALKCKTVRSDISGSGNMTVFASEALKTRLAGSGNVSYTGSPKNVDSNVVGSGRVKSE